MMKVSRAGSIPQNKTKMIELRCSCGKSVEILINCKGWWVSAKAMAGGLRWKLCENTSQCLSDRLEAICPNCNHGCQRRD